MSKVEAVVEALKFKPIIHPQTTGEKMLALGMAGNVLIFSSTLAYSLLNGYIPEQIRQEIIHPTIEFAWGLPHIAFDVSTLGGFTKAFFEKDSFVRRPRIGAVPYTKDRYLDMIKLDTPIENPFYSDETINEIPYIKNRFFQALLLSSKSRTLAAKLSMRLFPKVIPDWSEVKAELASSDNELEQKVNLVLLIFGRINRDLRLGKITDQLLKPLLPE